jgi:hypothetical protein
MLSATKNPNARPLTIADAERKGFSTAPLNYLTFSGYKPDIQINHTGWRPEKFFLDFILQLLLSNRKLTLKA